MGCMGVKLSVPYDVGCEADRTIDMCVLGCYGACMMECRYRVMLCVLLWGDAVIWLIVTLSN